MNTTLPWTQYIFNYTAPNVTTATLTFSFRNDPSFWYLDDVSVTNSSGQQFLLNGGFEQGTLADWVYCNPNNAIYSGSVYNANANGSSYIFVHSGSYSYADGSVGSPDYLSQTFNVIPYHVYTVSFWLSEYGGNMSFAWITISS